MAQGFKIIGFENRYRCKDGTYKWLSWTAQPDPKTGVSYAIAYDVTERKKTEKLLQKSKEQFKSIYSQSPIGIELYDSEGNLIDINNECLKIFGVDSVDAVKGFKLFEDPNVSEDVKISLKNGEVVHFETVFDFDLVKKLNLYETSKSGKIHVNVDISPWVIGGSSEGYLVHVEDITERKQAAEALRENEEKYRTLFSSMIEGVALHEIIYNKSGKPVDYVISDVNSPFEKILGISSEKAIGSKGSELYGADEAPYLDIYSKVAETGESTSFETYFPPMDMYFNISVFSPGKGKFATVFENITGRTKSKKALKESEAKFKILAEESPNMIFINKRGRVVYVNKKSEEIMGYSREEFLSKDFNFMNLIAPEYRDLVQKNYRKHAAGEEIPPYEYNLLTKDGREIFAIHTTKLIEYMGEQAILGMVTDITERKKSELAMKRRLMKFRLEDGDTYLVKESTTTKSLEAFKDLLNIGYHGVILSRSPEKEFSKAFKANFEFHWLAEKKTKNTISPRPKEIESQLEKIGRRTVVLIDRLDYLISKNGFDETLSFVHVVKEIAYLNGFVVVISIDPTTLTKMELRRLEKETLEVVRQHEILSEDQMDILKNIFEQNKIGIKPSYSSLGEKLGLSKPTVRKKLKELKSSGYVIEILKGRNKFVEITEKGNSLF
jgi:PAS domain S-box-containing protein